MDAFMKTRPLAKETHVPEYVIRAMIRNGTAPGFHSGKTFYIDTAAFMAKLSQMSATRSNVRTASAQ